MSDLFFTNTFYKNRDAWNDGVRFIDNRGGTRSGKNYAELQLMYMIAKYRKKRRVISVVGQTLPNLKLGAIKDFKNIVASFGENPEKYNKTDNIFNYGNSEIQFFSAENSDKVHGPARDILVLNEANKIPYEAADHLITRTTENVFFDYNPAKEFYVQTEILKFFPEQSRTIHTTYLDNLSNLPQHQIDYIEKKKLYAHEWWKVYGLGEIGNLKLGTEYYHAFSYARNVTEVGYDNTKPLHISFDFNVVPYITACIYQIDNIDGVYAVSQIDEICLANPLNNTRSLCRKIKEKYTFNEVFIYGDASGNNRSTSSNKSDYDIIKEEFGKWMSNYNYRVPKSNPRHSLRRDFVNECLAHVSDVVLLFDKSCVNTIKDLENVQENAEGGKLKTKTRDQSGQSYEEYGHCFVKDTIITVKGGDKKICDVKVGDYVLTRKGYKKVLKSGVNGRNREVMTLDFGFTKLTCTPDHKIFANNEFVFAKDLTPSVIFCILAKWKKKQLFTMVSNFIDTLYQKIYLTENISEADIKLMAKALKNIYTDTYGYVNEAKYQKDFTYITKTAITQITTYQTLRLLRGVNITDYITVIYRMLKRKRENNFLKKKYIQRQQNGTAQKRVLNGTDNTAKTHWLRGQLIALNVAKNIQRTILNAQQQNIAPQDVKTDIMHVGIELRKKKEKVLANKVYDITVEGQHEFFANGVLVHNCSDALDYLIMSAFKKK